MKTNNNEIEIFKALLQEEFKPFAQMVFKELNPSTEYKDNWHIDVICHELLEVMEGKNKRLIINIPPRHLKSIICSVAFPAFVLGHNPSATLICVSYAEDLAVRMALDCRKIIESGWYKEIFPATRLAPAKRAVNDFMTTRGGGRFSTSVGGILTGRGADYLIIDDPIKAEDAKSDTLRNGVNEWYDSTLISRLNDKKEGKIILIMQRVHQDDLTGHLLEKGNFLHIKMPALAEEEETWTVRSRLTGKLKIFTREVGEPLHAAREDMSIILNMKDSMGSINFAGQYQQNPMAEDGGIIRKDWIQYFDPRILPQHRATYSAYTTYISRIVISWDTACRAKEHNDYSVGMVFVQMSNKQIYVVDVIREKMEVPALIARVKSYNSYIYNKFYDSYGSPPNNVVEAIGSGISVAQILKAETSVHVKEITSGPDKATRLRNVAYLIENGRCKFPNNNPPWLKGLINELLVFPNGKHDDQADALAQGLLFLSKPPTHCFFNDVG